MIPASQSYAAVVGGVIVQKSSKRLAMQRVKAARRAGNEAFVGLSPNRQVGERWPSAEEVG